jgi:hypothetical protein
MLMLEPDAVYEAVITSAAVDTEEATVGIDGPSVPPSSHWHRDTMMSAAFLDIPPLVEVMFPIANRKLAPVVAVVTFSE